MVCFSKLFLSFLLLLLSEREIEGGRKRHRGEEQRREGPDEKERGGRGSECWRLTREGRKIKKKGRKSPEEAERLGRARERICKDSSSCESTKTSQQPFRPTEASPMKGRIIQTIRGMRQEKTKKTRKWSDRRRRGADAY